MRHRQILILISAALVPALLLATSCKRSAATASASNSESVGLPSTKSDIASVAGSSVASGETSILAVGHLGAAPAKPHYIGAEACGSCHEKQHQDWRGSDHDRAMQEVSEQSVLGDFDDASMVHYGRTAEFYRRGDDFMVSTEGPDGELDDFKVEYVFGHDPLQQYLVAMPGGRLQTLPFCWDSRNKGEGGQKWFHIRPSEPVPPGDLLHWTKPSQNWNYMCAECHSTRLTRNYDVQQDRFDTQWQELNVACESCHGPGSDHAAWADDPASSKLAQMGLVVDLLDRDQGTWSWDAQNQQPKRTPARTNHSKVESCAPCHSRRSPLGDDVAPGTPFLDAYLPALLDEGLYYADGQIQDEVYVWGSFLQSKMYHAGVTCTDCHDPHSQKLKLPGNLLCTQCHAGNIYDTKDHHHHRAPVGSVIEKARGGSGTSCVDCHMPPTTYMVVDPRRDHSFRVPRPDLSRELDAPNACNRCHDGAGPRWSTRKIASWRGEDAAPLPSHFGQAIALGRIGAPGAAEALSKLAQDNTQPDLARATALNLLADRAYPGLAQLTESALSSESGLLRMGAARAAANLDAQNRLQLLVPALSDVRKAVRIEAVRGMLPLMASLGLGADIEASFGKALGEYRQANLLTADRPGSRMNLALMHLHFGDPDAAEAEYLAALGLDNHYVPAAVNLADLYRSQNRDLEGATLLKKTLLLEAENADLLHALGLLQIRQGETEQALISLKEAAQAARNNPRYAYVLAVALQSSDREPEAIGAFRTGLKHNPWDVDLLVGLTQLYMQKDQLEDACKYAQKLVDARPDLGVGQQLLDLLK